MKETTGITTARRFAALAVGLLLILAACETPPEEDPFEVGFRHDPDNPADVSIADGSLSVRFEALQESVDRAVLVTEADVLVPMNRQLEYRNREVWRASIGATVDSYDIVVVDAQGETERHGPFDVPEEPFEELAWVGESVGYQIFPERFNNANPDLVEYALEDEAWNYKHPDHVDWDGPPMIMDAWDDDEITDFHGTHQYFGGDLEGIIEKLDYLEELGVTFVYLNPINNAGSAHGYDAVDFMEVAPNFGDEETVEELVAEAEARGIRLIWDFVPNHVGVGFWAFQEAIAEGGYETEYWDWFRFTVEPGTEIEAGNPEHYESWWDFGSLPELETRNEDVFDHLMEAARYWMEFGFSGVRIDVPNEIVNREEFFSALREEVRSVDPEAYIVGEIWGRDATWLQGDQFDSLMNYAVGQQAIEDYAAGNQQAHAAAHQMQLVYADYPEAATGMQFNIITSHDTQRLLTAMGGGELGEDPPGEARERQRLAAAMLYALPGMPVTFMGDEMGFLGSQNQDRHRYPIQWGEEHEPTVEFYQELAELKHGLDALDSAVIRDFETEESLLAFTRGEPGTGEKLVALFNNSSEQVKTHALPGGSWEDARTAETFQESVEVPPLGWRYLTKRR